MSLGGYLHNTNYEIAFLRKLGECQPKNGHRPLSEEERRARRLALLKQYRDSMPLRQDWANLDRERITQALDEMIAELEGVPAQIPELGAKSPKSLEGYSFDGDTLEDVFGHRG